MGLQSDLFKVSGEPYARLPALERKGQIDMSETLVSYSASFSSWQAWVSRALKNGK